MASTSVLGSRPKPGERLAALVALVSLGAAVAVVVVGVRANWRELAVGAAGLLVAVIATWQALGGRGARRAIAASVAVVGLLVFVIGVLLAGTRGFRVGLAVALGALAVASARVALGRSVRAMRRAALAQTPVAPARHPALLINLRSGGAKAERFHVVEECRARGIEPIVLGPDDDLPSLAEQAIAGGADVIGMAGGDGSQAAVAAVAMRHGVPHVVVPSGTRNHFALDLGLDRDDVVGALDAFGDAVERVVDVATVNGRVFVNNVSAGLYAQVVQSPEYRDAKRRTALAMLPDLIGPDADPQDLRFTDPDGTSHPTAHVILVSNDPYALHVLAGRGTRERLDAGVLGIAAIWIAGASEAGHYIALEATGRGARFPGLREWSAPQFRLDSDGPVQIGIDGETLRLDPPLLFESKPLALRVRLPRHAIGRSPRARAVQVISRSTVARLARLVAGSTTAPT